MQAKAGVAAINIGRLIRTAQTVLVNAQLMCVICTAMLGAVSDVVMLACGGRMIVQRSISLDSLWFFLFVAWCVSHLVLELLPFFETECNSLSSSGWLHADSLRRCLCSW